MNKSDESDEFEFPIPPEILSWIESQQHIESLGFHHYILVDMKIVRVPLLEFARWFEDPENRRIEQTVVGDASISTVFLGLDHNFCFDDLVHHRPVLFESMVFGGHLDQFQWRYSTLGEAKRGHYELVEALRNHREPHIKSGEKGFWNWFREMFD